MRTLITIKIKIIIHGLITIKPDPIAMITIQYRITAETIKATGAIVIIIDHNADQDIVSIVAETDIGKMNAEIN